MLICAAMAGKQLKSACRQFLWSLWDHIGDTHNVGLNSLSVQPGKDLFFYYFFFAVSSARDLHSARFPIACSVVVAAPGFFPIPTFLHNPAQCFLSFPLCFLPGAEAAECIRPSPNRAGLIWLFWYLPQFLSSETISLPLHHVPCLHLQNRAMLFGRYWCLWKIIVIFLCGLCVNPLNCAN